jgi:hypothetical protein
MTNKSRIRADGREREKAGPGGLVFGLIIINITGKKCPLWTLVKGSAHYRE